MGTIYGVGDTDGGGDAGAARPAARRARRRRTGRAAYTPLIAVGLMVFYVYALMCMSTVAVTVREAGGGRTGWRWAGVQFAYMLALAYVAALVGVPGRSSAGVGRMSVDPQRLAVLAVVLLALAFVARRAWSTLRPKSDAGCGSGCGCDTGATATDDWSKS